LEGIFFAFVVEEICMSTITLKCVCAADSRDSLSCLFQLGLCPDPTGVAYDASSAPYSVGDRNAPPIAITLPHYAPSLTHLASRSRHLEVKGPVVCM